MKSDWGMVGNPQAVSFLKESIKSRNISHAYLLSAPEHTGKTTLSLKFAQALNCERPSVEGQPCRECDQCVRIATGKHSDVQVISNIIESVETKGRVEISIEQIRDITRASAIPPYEGKCRVFIIECADKLSKGAANALLKTLEEPVTFVVIILTTSREQLIPETVRSRCIKMNIGLAANHDIKNYLVQELKTEEGLATLISRLAEGKTGWAISAVNDREILENRCENIDYFAEILISNFTSRFQIATKLALRFNQQRNSSFQLLQDWVSLTRDMLMLKLDIKDRIINTDYREKLEYFSKIMNFGEIRTTIRALVETKLHLEKNCSPRLAFEVLMLNLPFSGGKCG